MRFDDNYLEKRQATFGELKKNILAQDAKSEYKQAAIIMVRSAFKDLEQCDSKCLEENSGSQEHSISHCTCSVDETTGWTQIKCCNICGKLLKDQNWHCG